MREQHPFQQGGGDQVGDIARQEGAALGYQVRCPEGQDVGIDHPQTVAPALFKFAGQARVFLHHRERPTGKTFQEPPGQHALSGAYFQEGPISGRDPGNDAIRDSGID